MRGLSVDRWVRADLVGVGIDRLTLERRGERIDLDACDRALDRAEILRATRPGRASCPVLVRILHEPRTLDRERLYRDPPESVPFLVVAGVREDRGAARRRLVWVAVAVLAVAAPLL